MDELKTMPVLTVSVLDGTSILQEQLALGHGVKHIPGLGVEKAEGESRGRWRYDKPTRRAGR